jgi:hypothetical protein
VFLFVCLFFNSFLSDFGELSKKLAEVWKQLPEKDKLVSIFYYVGFNVFYLPVTQP